jgi:hypothetical protein
MGCTGFSLPLAIRRTVARNQMHHPCLVCILLKEGYSDVMCKDKKRSDRISDF